MAGNARSPDDSSTLLANLSLDENKGTSRQAGAGLTARVAMPPKSAQYPRQQREGYGFRPRSGQSTPMEEGAQAPFSPVLNPVKSGSSSAARKRAEEDEDEDDKYGYHAPDRISVGELRQGVKDELERHGDKEGTLVVQGPGIADADGLGWPGRSCPRLVLETCSD
jgi:GTP cyclohydrolase I